MLFFSLVLTLVIGFVPHKTIGFVSIAEEEQAGVDGSEHAETGYDLGSFGAGARGVSFGGLGLRGRLRSIPTMIRGDGTGRPRRSHHQAAHVG